MHTPEQGEERSNTTSVLSALSPKTSFLVGLVGGVMALCTIGFFVLLTTYLQGNFPENSGKVAGTKTANSNSNTNVAAAPADNAAPANVDFEIKDTDYVLGNKDAKVTIVEFTDIQCPYCNQFHKTMNQLMEKYPDDVRWVIKHFPLDSIHPQARPAALATECVADQKGNEGFWSFIDEMFANQASLSDSYYEEVAGDLGLDVDAFKDCYSSGEFADVVDAQYQEGVDAGVRGTPGSYINGKALGGAVPLAQLEAEVKNILN